MLILRVLFKIRNNFIQQVANAEPLLCRKCDGRANTELVKIVDRIRILNVIHLIHAEHDRLARPAKHFCNLRICRRNAFPPIHKKNDDIRRFDCKLCLPAHLHADNIIARGLDSPGIHQSKVILKPCRVTIDSIPRNAGRIFHNGDPLSDNLVKKCGFSHVGPAHNRNQRFCHIPVYLVLFPVF